MASTYSTNLKIQEIGNGEQSGVWGTSTNTNWELIEQAVAGVQTITMANADYTLTNLNGVSDEARNMVLVVNGTNSAIRKIVAPQNQSKFYIVSNQTTGGYAITIGAATGSIITIPNGVTAQVYTDGTNFYSAQTGSAGNFNVNGNLSVNGTYTFTGLITGTVTSANSATNIAGGAASQILYQTATGVTGFVSAPSVPQTAMIWDGTNLVWAPVVAAVANGCIYENNQIITSNYTMNTGKSGESAGPITMAPGVTVTIPAGSRWVIL